MTKESAMYVWTEGKVKEHSDKAFDVHDVTEAEQGVDSKKERDDAIGAIPPAAATKEFFQIATYGTEKLYDNNYWIDSYRIDADYEYAGVTFRVPADFTSLTAIKLCWAAIGSVTNMAINWNAYYRATGEFVSQHNETGTITRTTTASMYYEDAFTMTGLVALDLVSIQFSRPVSGNANMRVVGINFKYA